MKIYNWLKVLPFYAFIPLVLGVMLIVSCLFYLLNMDVGDNPLVSGYDLFMLIVIGSIAVPVLETLFLQLVPIEIVLLIKKNWAIPAGIISAVLFASTHWFSVFYLLYTFIFGIILAGAYIICRDKKGVGYAFAIVTMTHALWNTIVTVVEFLESSVAR